jgi:hypothetical protein
MKTKILTAIVILLCLNQIASGQVTEAEKALRTQKADSTQGWKKGGSFTVNMAQTSLTNWAAGGQNSLAFGGLFNGFANLVKGKSQWDNTLDVGYGLLKQGKDEDFRKTDDKFDFSSKYGKEAFKNFYYSGLLNFRTQMSAGYNLPSKKTISDFLSPGYLTLALGLDYKPNAHFSAFIAPLTGKFTFVMNDSLSNEGAFGVTPGSTTKSEFGGYIRTTYTKDDFKGEFLKNIAFTTKLDLFSNYLDNPQNIDVNWEVLIALNVNKFITVNINTLLIYDDNIKVPYDVDGDNLIADGEGVASKIQFKEILGIGLSFKF